MALNKQITAALNTWDKPHLCSQVCFMEFYWRALQSYSSELYVLQPTQHPTKHHNSHNVFFCRLSSAQLVAMATDVSSGLSYMELKGYVHQ